MEGKGNSSEICNYQWIDKSFNFGGLIKYRLCQIDYDGKKNYSKEVEINILPTQTKLFQNFPNPFNPVTKITFQLKNESKVSIKIYNILGELMENLIDEIKKPGIYSIDFIADELYSSGVYICAFSADNEFYTKKILLQK